MKPGKIIFYSNVAGGHKRLWMGKHRSWIKLQPLSVNETNAEFRAITIKFHEILNQVSKTLIKCEGTERTQDA